MYKITLYDMNCCPVCDGTESFFVDKLEEFEVPWLQKKWVDDDTKDRFLRSKNGEIVTDYYSDDEELNIVQEDKTAVILFEKEFNYSDKEFNLSNVYDCCSKIYARKAGVKLRYIKFKNKYFLVGKYKLSGVCREDICQKFLHNVSGCWEMCKVYGNPIHNTTYNKKEFWIDEESGLRRNDYSKEEFKDDVIETFCWIIVDVGESEESIKPEQLGELSDDFFAVLMRDIPGEAG